MSKYQAYPEYKDSGVEWIGEIPKNWYISKMAFFYKIAMGQTILKENLRDDGIWPVFSATEGDHYFGMINDPVVQLDIGDIVIPARGNSIGSVKIVIEKATTTQTTIYCKQYTCSKIFPKFAYYFLNGSRKYLFQFTQTAIPQITTEEVSSNPIILTSYDDQQKIANFLDHETAKIDTLIEKQQQLIQLLKEKRQAVISHAVTKGLNPNVPMKDSGVEWLGEVPEHWSVVPIKRVCEVKDGTHDTPQYVDPSDETFPLITSKDFDGDEISFSNAKYISKEDHDEIIKRSNTEVGDVLMSMIGGNIGKALIVKKHANFSIKNVALFKTSGCEVLAKYILYYLQSGLLDVQISLLSRGGAQGFLSLGDLRNLVFFKVPRQELEEIIASLNSNVTKFDNLIIKAVSTIGIMQERRTALISAAVTGKIDVRDWQGPTVIANETNPQEVSV